MSAAPACTRELAGDLRQLGCVLGDLAARRPGAPAGAELVARADALAGAADQAGLLRFHRPTPAGCDHATLARIGARRARQAQLARRCAQAGAGRDGFGHH